MKSQNFDFGRNWQEFSRHTLDEEKIRQAAEELSRLFDGIPLEGMDFLDIGFGQGLSLLLATRMGARTCGNDVNPLCAQVLESNRAKFPDLSGKEISVVVGSILDRDTVQALRDLTPGGAYDIVHSWGVLHHTGAMWKGIDIAAGLVKPGGVLVLALYNRHWTAPVWKHIKAAFNRSPAVVQKVLTWGYIGLSVSKMALSGDNPFVRERGMDIYYDAVDWMGGTPYEYASREEVVSRLGGDGFSLTRYQPTRGFTGCNEYVFRRIDC